MAINDGPDRFIYSADVETGAQGLVVGEDQDDSGTYETTDTIQVAAGEYWGHNDDSFDGTLAGLFKALEDALNASTLGNTYAIEAQTPAGSQVTNSGLRFRATNADPHPFRIDFAAAGSTLPPWLIGWRGGWAGGSEPTPTSSGGVIDSPVSARLYHQPWPLFTNSKRASEKTWDEERELYVSHDDEREQFQVEHGEPTETRMYWYQWQAAAHVRDGKALDATHASNAGLPTGDVNNAFYHLWSRASRKHKVIVVHNAGDEDLQVDAHTWETGYLAGLESRKRFSPALERVKDGGEFHDVQFRMVILDGNADSK